MLRIGLNLRRSQKFLDRLDTLEDDILTSSCDVREQAMLDGVVLASTGRIGCDTDGDTNFVSESLQVLFEDVVNEQQYPFRQLPLIHTVHSAFFPIRGKKTLCMFTVVHVSPSPAG